MVQVSSERAPKDLWGLWGEVAKLGPQSLTFKEHKTGLNKVVRREYVLAISQGPTEPAVDKRSCLHLTGPQKAQMRSFFHKYREAAAAPESTTWFSAGSADRIRRRPDMPGLRMLTRPEADTVPHLGTRGTSPSCKGSSGSIAAP